MDKEGAGWGGGWGAGLAQFYFTFIIFIVFFYVHLGSIFIFHIILLVPLSPFFFLAETIMLQQLI